MDLRQLKYFLAVAEAGGFSKGAERVHVAQPALSGHISRLEDELQAVLFVRSPRGVSLTRAGTVLVDHAEDILRRVRVAQDAVRYASDEIYGEVSLGVPATVSMSLTLPLLQQVRTCWPQISLRILEGHSGWLLEWLGSRRVDAAVLFGAVSAKGVRVIPLLEEDLYFVGPATPSVDSSIDTIAMCDIARYPLCLPARGHGLRTTIDRAAESAGVELQVIIEMDSLDSNKRATRAGLAHTILSMSAVAEEIRNGELSARRIVDPFVRRSVVLGVREDRVSDPACVKLVESLHLQIIQLVESGRWPAKLAPLSP